MVEELMLQLGSNGPVWVLCALLIWAVINLVKGHREDVQSLTKDHREQIMTIIDSHSAETRDLTAAINDLRVVVEGLKEKLDDDN